MAFEDASCEFASRPNTIVMWPFQLSTSEICNFMSRDKTWETKEVQSFQWFHACSWGNVSK